MWRREKGKGGGKKNLREGGVWRSDQAGQPKKGQGTMSLAGSRGGAPCGVWGNAPTAAPLDQLCQTRQFRSTNAEQRSAFSAAVVSLRVRRRAPQSALPIICTLSRRWARPDSMAKQNALREERRSTAHAGQEKNDRLHLILFPNSSGNSVKFPQNKHVKKPCGLNPQGNFIGKGNEELRPSKSPSRTAQSCGRRRTCLRWRCSSGTCAQRTVRRDSRGSLPASRSHSCGSRGG